MKKKLITLMLAACVLASGCGGNAQEKETEGSVVKEEGKKETDSGGNTDERETIDGFEKADYEKFNSYAEENGLDGTLIYIEGKVLNQTKIEDSEPPLLSVVVEQEDGNRWAVSTPSDSKIDAIQDKNIRVFGTYLGFSDVINLPSLAVVSEDESKQELARIEVENNGEYETVWKFSDYVKEELIENDKEENKEDSNKENIDTFKYSYDENNTILVNLSKDKDTGEMSIYSFCQYDEKNFGMMQEDFVSIASPPFEKGLDIGYFCSVGEDSYSYIRNDGKNIMDTVTENEVVPVPDEYKKNVQKMKKKINSFYQKHGIAEKEVNTLVYEDEKVKIHYKGLNDKGVVFGVENMTDSVVTIQASTISINRNSINDITMSDEVSPQSTGDVVARCEVDSETDVEEIGGQLRIIDFDGGFDSYSATFVNVPIE